MRCSEIIPNGTHSLLFNTVAEASAKRELKNLDVGFPAALLIDSNREVSMREAWHRERIRSCVSAIGAEYHSFDASRFFSFAFGLLQNDRNETRSPHKMTSYRGVLVETVSGFGTSIPYATFKSSPENGYTCTIHPNA